MSVSGYCGFSLRPGARKLRLQTVSEWFKLRGLFEKH
jgi:hypothetical protein